LIVSAGALSFPARDTRLYCPWATAPFLLVLLRSDR
jgi:hypothetical protein